MVPCYPFVSKMSYTYIHNLRKLELIMHTHVCTTRESSMERWGGVGGEGEGGMETGPQLQVG